MTHTSETEYTEAQQIEPRHYQPQRGGGFGMFLAGFLIGGLASASYALLNVPQSGKQTREQIKAKAGELRGRAEEELQHVSMQAFEVLSNARMQVDEMQTKLSERAEDIQGRVAGAIREGKKGAKAVERELTESRASSTETEAQAAR